MINHVLVPLDGSAHAEKALSYAEQIIEPSGKITLLTVVDMPVISYPISPSPPLLPYETQDYRSHRKAKMKEAAQYLMTVAEKLAVQHVDTKIVDATDVALAIIELADQLSVDAIVMATHGRAGLGHWLMGSITHKVLQANRYPIMVIPVQKTAK